MPESLEDKFKQAIRDGKDEFVVKSEIKKMALDEELSAYLNEVVDDELALEKIRDVRRADANLLVYTGFFFMVLALVFGMYSKPFGILVFGIGFVVKRRGDRKRSEAGSIKSLEELLPDHNRKFR